VENVESITVIATEQGDFVAAAMSAPPMRGDLAGRIAYLREASTGFARLVESPDLDAPVWMFGSVGPARFWLLRAATETAVHPLGRRRSSRCALDHEPAALEGRRLPVRSTWRRG
jgi:hypothetical protein